MLYILYQVLNFIVLILFAKIGRVIIKSRWLNIYTGFYLGLGFFLILPIFVLTILGNYSLPEWHMIQGEWGSVDFNDINNLIPMISIYAIIVILLLIINKNIHRCDGIIIDDYLKKYNIKHVVSIYNKSLFLYTIAIISVIIYKGGIASYLNKGWYSKERSTITGTEIDILINACIEACYITFLSCGLLRMINNPKDKYNFVTLIIALISVMISGNRIFIAIFSIIFLFIFLPRKNYLKTKISILLTIPFIGIFFGFYAYIRGASNIDELLNLVSNRYDSLIIHNFYISDRIIEMCEGANILVLLGIFKSFGQHVEYLMGMSYMKIILFPIPRSIYPDKPISYNEYIGSIFETGGNTSLSSTIIGEGFGNFGYGCVIIIPIVFIVFKKISDIFNYTAEYIPIKTIVIMFISMWFIRSFFSDIAIKMLITLTVLKIITWKSSVRKI